MCASVTLEWVLGGKAFLQPWGFPVSQDSIQVIKNVFLTHESSVTFFDGVRVRKWSWRAGKWNGVFGRVCWVEIEYQASCSGAEKVRAAHWTQRRLIPKADL